MKTIVLTFSRQFPKYHPSAGKDTNFVESILSGKKQTTIRGNYERWSDIADKLDANTHILSLRYWNDKPYRSKQTEFARLSKVDLKEVFITNTFSRFEISVDDCYLYHESKLKIAQNEGFDELKDFTAWFTDEEFTGAMIAFLNIEKV
tara:strand:- start:1242 stop:1685 length:444 start_codon:yes stop_codon:yes gene_type:complete